MFQSYVVKEDKAGLAGMFKCTICGKSMAQKRNAINHVENIHFPGSVEHKCPYCEKTLKSRDALNNHIKSHKNAAFASGEYELV